MTSNRRTILLAILTVLVIVIGVQRYLDIIAERQPIVETSNEFHTPLTQSQPGPLQATTTDPGTDTAQIEIPAAPPGALDTTPTELVLTPEKATVDALLANMHQTFNEDFNSFSWYRDENDHVLCDSGGSGVWQTVYHFCSRTIASNNEAELYIDPHFLSYLNSRSTIPTTARNPISVIDGILTIEAAPTDDVIKNAAGAWAKYTSGLITTQFSFSQQYGYFEMRAKLPKGRGLWPAFWLLPIDKSWPPEVDAMEAFGDTSSRGEGGVTKIHYASHSQVKSEKCGGWYDTGVDITADFHTYGVLVEESGMTYYFDGKAYASCPKNSGTNQPFYMLVNLAVGGPGSWPEVPDATTQWPAYMRVDYVRAYQTN